jgi:hypothetical protein
MCMSHPWRLRRARRMRVLGTVAGDVTHHDLALVRVTCVRIPDLLHQPNPYSPKTQLVTNPPVGAMIDMDVMAACVLGA